MSTDLWQRTGNGDWFGVELMAESCVCGNVLDSEKAIVVRVSPCRCVRRGGGRRQSGVSVLPGWVGEEQYTERKRLGLPVVTDIERGADARWD